MGNEPHVCVIRLKCVGTMAEVSMSTLLAQLGSGETAPVLMPYLINVTVIAGKFE